MPKGKGGPFGNGPLRIVPPKYTLENALDWPPGVPESQWRRALHQRDATARAFEKVAREIVEEVVAVRQAQRKRAEEARAAKPKHEHPKADEIRRMARQRAGTPTGSQRAIAFNLGVSTATVRKVLGRKK